MKRFFGLVLALVMVIGLMPTGAWAAEPVQNTDGNYYVDIALYKETKDEPSMGNVAFENNPKALVTVENGKVTTVQMATNPVQVSTFYSGIVAISLRDVETIEITEKQSMQTKNGDEVLVTYGYIRAFRFTLPVAAQPTDAQSVTYEPVSFLVPDTPMGNGYMDARLRFDWSTAVKTGNRFLGSSDKTGGNQKVHLVDPDYGFEVHTYDDKLDPQTELSVSRVYDGAGYDAAKKAMKSLDRYFDVYLVETFLNGEKTDPTGTVKLTIPCGEEGLEIYRINPDGTKVAIRGEVRDGAYWVNTRQMGVFAFAGDKKVRFTDVNPDGWAAEYVDFAVQHNLFKGMTDTTFAPNLAMNRAMFVTVLGRLAGVGADASGKTDFPDVPEQEYYAPYVRWAAANGIVKGMPNGTFEPNAKVTRQQMAAILARYCESAGIELEKVGEVSFPDADKIQSWAVESVQTVAEAGMLRGDENGNFNPGASATRAEVATLLTRFMRLYVLF